MTAMLCVGRPSDWWETGDGGNRLALAICAVCPARQACAAGSGREAGVIRAGVAYTERGKVARICSCGYPDDKLPDPRRTTVLCRRCEVPQVRAWRQDRRRYRRRYWADYYRRRKAELEAARSGADLGDVLAGVAGPAGDLGLGHAAGHRQGDSGVQFDAALVEGFLGAPERPGGLFEGVRHVAECDTG